MTETTARYKVRPLRSAEDIHQELENLLEVERILTANLDDIRFLIAHTRETIATTRADQASALCGSGGETPSGLCE